MTKKEKTGQTKAGNKDRVPELSSDIHKLCGFGSTEDVVNLASKDNFEVDQLDSLGNTPLIWAARGGSSDCVEFLCKSGAAVNHRAYGGLNALHHACNSAHGHLCVFRD